MCLLHRPPRSATCVHSQACDTISGPPVVPRWELAWATGLADVASRFVGLGLGLGLGLPCRFSRWASPPCAMLCLSATKCNLPFKTAQPFDTDIASVVTPGINRRAVTMLPANSCISRRPASKRHVPQARRTTGRAKPGARQQPRQPER